MLRVAKLEADLYEEIKDDSRATAQALEVVLVTGVVAGIGSMVSVIIEEGFAWAIWGLLFGVSAAIVGWFVWSFITYLVGTRLLRRPETSATYNELLRTIGFSNSPNVIRILSFIPVLGGVVQIVALLWTLVAGVIAVRQTLGFSTWRAIATCGIGWVIYVAVLVGPVLVPYSIVKLT